VLIRGTLTDAATGKPIAGAVARAVVPNPQSYHPHAPQARTGDDGTIALAVPPGLHSKVLVQGPNNDYVAVETTSGELSGGKRFGYRSYPDAVIPFKAKAGADPLTAKLRRGVTIRGKLLGPGDKPVAYAMMACWHHQVKVPVRDGRFEVRGCDPK